jgi:hypothetical protein
MFLSLGDHGFPSENNVSFFGRSWLDLPKGDKTIIVIVLLRKTKEYKS